MDRNTFIRTCAAYGVGSMIVPAWLSSCASMTYYAEASFSEKSCVVMKSAFIGERKGHVFTRNFVLVKDDNMEFPICIYKIGEEYVALYTRCTHQGCQVKPQGTYLVCPCHGSEYDHTGKVLSPPAEENLQKFKVTSDEEAIHIYW